MTWQVYHVGILASDRDAGRLYERDGKGIPRPTEKYTGSFNGGPRRLVTALEIREIRALNRLASDLYARAEKGEILLSQKRRDDGSMEYLFREATQ